MSRRIVVGFDDHEPAKRALEHAIEEARSRHARLIVVAVAEAPLDPLGPRNFGTLDDGPVARRLEAPPDVERALADAKATVEGSGVRADYVWAAGDPARSIVDVARERDAEAIVLGSHHEGLFSRLFGLGVAEAVRKEAACDVVVVP